VVDVPNSVSVRDCIWVRRTLWTDKGYGGAGADRGDTGGGVIARGWLLSLLLVSGWLKDEDGAQSGS
jgi:hypothetical protein